MIYLSRHHTEFKVKGLSAKLLVMVLPTKDWTVQMKYLIMQMVNSLPKEVNIENRSEVHNIVLACEVIESIAIKEGKSSK